MSQHHNHNDICLVCRHPASAHDFKSEKKGRCNFDVRFGTRDHVCFCLRYIGSMKERYYYV